VKNPIVKKICFNKKIILIFSLILCIIIIVYSEYNFKFIHQSRLFIEKSQIELIKKYIESHLYYAEIIYFLIFCIKTLFIFFPCSLLVILGGSIFGHFYGFVLSMFSLLTSATIAFYISRLSSKQFIQKLLGKKMKNIDEKIEQHGFKFIFIMRISFIFPFDVLSYVSGLTKIKYKDFILGTFLGLLPEVFSLTFMGGHLNNPRSSYFLLSVFFVILTVAIPIIYNKLNINRASKE